MNERRCEHGRRWRTAVVAAVAALTLPPCPPNKSMPVARLPAELALPQSDLDSLDLPEQPANDDNGRRRTAAAMSPAIERGVLPQRPLSVIEALELPARLEALGACDAAVVPYNPESFGIVFTLRGRNAGAIAIPLACLLVWGCVAAALFEVAPTLREVVLPLEDVFSPMLTTISFLLVFRLGRAAVRYWDARAAAGKMVEICRVIASDSAIACAEAPELRDTFARYLAVFPVAVKNFLRPATRECSRLSELVPLVTEAEAHRLLDAERTCAPIFVLNRLRQAAFDVAQQPTLEPMLRAAIYRELAASINTLTGAWGAMERINGTPLPFVYVAHLRTFLLLYLGVFWAETLARFSWAALPVRGPLGRAAGACPAVCSAVGGQCSTVGGSAVHGADRRRPPPPASADTNTAMHRRSCLVATAVACRIVGAPRDRGCRAGVRTALSPPPQPSAAWPLCVCRRPACGPDVEGLRAKQCSESAVGEST